jgi:L-aspartate oxidase
MITPPFLFYPGHKCTLYTYSRENKQMAHSQQFDVAIIGGGIAGLSVALRLPEHLRIALFTKGLLGESNTRYAQGGLAVALGEDDDPELHLRDTLAAGAGLCDEAAVRVLVEQAPGAVRWLMQMGVQFDRARPGSSDHATPDGLLLGREAAHSRWRVIHAGGDATGAEIERALVAAVQRRSSVTVFAETCVTDLLVRDGKCVGVQALYRDGHTAAVFSHAVVLANGGAGNLWLHTSNPAGATADGIALAWRSGAAVTDLEFMQFHPTVLAANGSSHLISEAVRGEGAYLRNHAGERFMSRYSALEELAPRDVVARAILSEMLAEGTEYQYLDLRHLPAQRMHDRFPTISAICKRYGLNLTADLLPVAPAAHYCMGGVMVDSDGRTTLPGLYAVGEVSCTGVHGANRLASNSLLEGLVFGLRVADRLSEHQDVQNWQPASREEATYISYSDVISEEIPLSSQADVWIYDRAATERMRTKLRRIMWQHVSLSRTEDGLHEALAAVQQLRRSLALSKSERDDIGSHEIANMLLVAQLVIAAALERRESRGSHWRLDYPAREADLDGHHYVFQRPSIDRWEYTRKAVSHATSSD